MSAVRITIKELHKRFGLTAAVDGVNLDVAAGSLTALVGPSGCGKSTTLSLIAGLAQPDGGDVAFDEVSVLSIAPERRRVGLMFQKSLLFPHMTVAQNIGFGLRMQGASRSVIRQRVAELLDQVQLSGFGDRRVGELSGGQEQRVALARAIAVRPSVLLLDEPFSQLDAQLRAEMRELVRSLHHEYALTTLFVTHDQSEAVDVADCLAVMIDGHVEATGEPQTLLQSPPTRDAARLLGATNILHGDVTAGVFVSDGGSVRMCTGVAAGRAALWTRPDMISLTDANDAAKTTSGTVVAASFAGAYVRIELQLAGEEKLTVHVPPATSVQLGQSLSVAWQPHQCAVFAERQA